MKKLLTIVENREQFPKTDLGIFAYESGDYTISVYHGKNKKLIASFELDDIDFSKMGLMRSIKS